MAAFWVPLIWLLVAAVLLVLELAQPSLDGLIFAALAALVVSVLTALGSWPLGLQAGLFMAITLAGTLWLMHWSEGRNPEAVNRGQREDLAEVIEPIPAGGDGRVRWHGQSWAAASLDLDRDLSDGDQVLVVGREGTQLQVMGMATISRRTED